MPHIERCAAQNGFRMNSVTSDFLFAQPSALAGVARFSDFSGSFDSYNRSDTEAEADAFAMYADWAVVADLLSKCLLSTLKLEAR